MGEETEAIRAALPRRYQETQGFTLGSPRSFAISEDGRRVFFLRSRSGRDPNLALHLLEVESGEERLLADPLEIDPRGRDDTPEEEWIRRERSREQALGIVAYSIDAPGEAVTFALRGRLYLLELGPGRLSAIETPAAVMDPRINRQGTAIAFVSRRSLWSWSPGGPPRPLATARGSSVSWGLAEHLAAEEMGRDRGHWWSPEGDRLLVARVDVSRLPRTWVRPNLDPRQPPGPRSYPFAGAPSAGISLHLLELDGHREAVDLPRSEPYLLGASWGPGGILAVTQTRDQRRLSVREVDPGSGSSRLLLSEQGSPWVEAAEGLPARLADGRLVWVGEREGWRRLLVGGEVCSPPGLEVDRVAAVRGDQVWVTGSTEPTEVQVWRWDRGRLEPVTGDPGVHQVVAGSGVEVVTSRRLGPRPEVSEVRRGERPAITVGSLAERPAEGPVEFQALGEDRIRAALLLPSGHRPGQPLPVLLDPYGGPGSRRVLSSELEWVVPRWLAEQGMAVIVADGRGTPGRGTSWARSVHRDLATPALEGQIEALHRMAERVPELDLERVAIRGWSFGGYLAALALLRRPDIFSAAAIGAPVADWEQYDSYVSERYLGDPRGDPDAYRRSSLLEAFEPGPGEALIIHGAADDNVLLEHSLQLARRLALAGRSASLVLLDGVTHMWRASPAAAAKLELEAAFLRRSLHVQDVS